MPIKKFLFILASLIFLLFIYLSYLVSKETFTQFDFDITVKLQDRIPRKLDLPFSFFSILGSVEVTTLIWLFLGLAMLIKRYFLSLILLILFPASVAVEVFGKLFVHHPAPPFLFYRGVLDFNFPSHFVVTDYSYPSGHMTRTAYLIFFLFLLFQFRLGFVSRTIFQLMIAGILILMFISRVYLGEHWLSDVAGGLLLGGSFGLLAGLAIPLKKRIYNSSKS